MDPKEWAHYLTPSALELELLFSELLADNVFWHNAIRAEETSTSETVDGLSLLEETWTDLLDGLGYRRRRRRRLVEN